MTKQPFTGTEVYYSGSISGVEEVDLEFPEQLVQYMQRNGALILDPHVAVSQRLKMDRYLDQMIACHGISLEEWKRLTKQEQDLRIYEQDIRLVDRATHVVVLANGPSLGVGMELQEALRKPELGLNATPILGLVHKDLLTKVSAMVLGAARKYSQIFSIKTYGSLQEAQEAIHNFLTL